MSGLSNRQPDGPAIFNRLPLAFPVTSDSAGLQGTADRTGVDLLSSQWGKSGQAIYIFFLSDDPHLWW